MTTQSDSLPLSLLLLALWRASWQGALVLLFLGVLCRVFARRLPADAHCWLWRLGYAKLLLGLLWSGAVLLPLLSPVPPLPAALPSAASPSAAPQQGLAAPVTSPALPAAVTTDAKSPSWQAWLAIAYGAGVAFCFTRLLLAAGRTRRILRSSVPDAGPNMALAAALARQIGLRCVPPLARSAAVDSPVYVVGTILLPAEAQYAEAEMRMIFAHELAHAKRRDLLWEWLGTLVQAAFFFHPFVVLARREERLAREAAADALALQATEAHAAEYGELLLSLSLQQNRPRPQLVGAVGVIEGGSLLHRRLLALRDGASRTNAPRTRRLAFALVPLLALVFVPWKMTHGQSPAPALASALAAPDDAPKMPAGNKQITGVVVDEQGKPVTKIGVGLIWYWSRTQNGEQSGGSRPLPPAFADAQGRFHFSGLPPGKFRYGVYSQDERYVAILSPLVIRDDETTKTLRVTVSTGSLVTGRVVDGQTGKPMAGIFVGAGSIPPGGDLAKWDFWEMPTTGTTDAEGRYQLRVMPGDVFVGIGRITNNTLFSRRVRDAAQRVTVQKGQTASVPDIPLFLHPIIVCVGPDGQPVANTVVRITPDNLGSPGTYLLDDTTDSTGAVVLDRFENGTFSIIRGTQAASGTFRWSPGQPLIVTINGQTHSYADGTAMVRLAEGSAGVLTGTVLSTDGSPIANARVHVVQISSNSAVADFDFRTDASGIFHAMLDPSGQYDFHVRADGFNQVAVKPGGASLVAGTTANLGVIRLVRADGFVSGRVVDSAGKPMPGILVYVKGDKTNLSANVTNDQGHFRIPNVVTGEMLTLNLCLVGQSPDSGQALSQSNEEMRFSGVEASPTEREIVWNPHT